MLHKNILATIKLAQDIESLEDRIRIAKIPKGEDTESRPYSYNKGNWIYVAGYQLVRCVEEEEAEKIATAINNSLIEAAERELRRLQEILAVKFALGGQEKTT